MHIIARDNGAGLSRDLVILTRTLAQADFEVTLSAIGAGGLRRSATLLRRRAQRWWRRWRGAPAQGRFDVNLMDERIRPEYLPLARRNVLLPHPEWFAEQDRPWLGALDAVFAKTRHAVPIFSALGCATRFVGFTSFDRELPAVARSATFFHLGGRSPNKGTQVLVDAWLQAPHWPTLTLVQRAPLRLPAQLPANLRCVRDYLDDDTLQRLQNEHLFHLCPSETEGFGHHLVEGLSVGAITLATDAPPMNEMVTPERGVLVPWARRGSQRLATTYFVEPAAISAGVEHLLALDQAQCAQLRANARAWWLANAAAFGQRLRGAIAELASNAAAPAAGAPH